MNEIPISGDENDPRGLHVTEPGEKQTASYRFASLARRNEDDFYRLLAVEGIAEDPSSPEAKRWFWKGRLAGLKPVSPEFAYDHIRMWDGSGFVNDPAIVTSLLGLREGDDETTRAASIALFSVFNCTFGVNLDVVLMAMSCLLHAHPAFKHMLEPDMTEPEFGPETKYILAQIQFPE